jgi:hypothetical protein
MANSEHLKILKQGYMVWNKWRKEKSRYLPEKFLAFTPRPWKGLVNSSLTEISP